MEEKDVGSIRIEEDIEPVGIVTDRDLTRRVLVTGTDPTELTAETVMSHSPATVDADAGLIDVTTAMAGNEVRLMPVVENGDLVGISTQCRSTSSYRSRYSNEKNCSSMNDSFS